MLPRPSSRSVGRCLQDVEVGTRIVKPPKFDYIQPATVEEAIEALAAADGGGKVIAGGQSLMPMMNFRLLSPTILVDINRIEALSKFEEREDGLVVGALTRHRVMETSEVVKRRFPVINAAMAHVAHLAIRNRGTIGGSITHADGAAELPMMMLLLETRITMASPRGIRTVDAEQFFVGALTSAVEDDELVTEIFIPDLAEGHGWAFEEVARRSGDFALAAVAIIMVVEDGKVAEARVGVMGVGETPMRLFDVETVLWGEALSDDLVDAAVAAAREAVSPMTDLHASGEYRRHLLGVLVKRALHAAWKRANGEQVRQLLPGESVHEH